MSEEAPDSRKRQAGKKEAPTEKPRRSFLRDFGRGVFVDAIHKPRLVVCPQGVVTYTLAANPGTRILGHLLNPERVDTRIREILAANPDTVFTPELQRALGITVEDFQKTRREPPPPDDEGVLF